MAVGVNRDLDRMMPQLIPNIGQAFPLLDEKACEAMPLMPSSA